MQPSILPNQQPTPRSLRSSVGFLIGGVLLGSAVTAGVVLPLSWHEQAKHQPEVRQGGYTFINPLLECGELSSAQFHQLDPAEQAVEDLIDSYKQKGIVDEVSVYFRDLNNGPWFGISEDNTFIPASLFKVPTMIATLRLAEQQPGFLEKSVQYVVETGSYEQQVFQPPERMQAGQSYTIRDLLERMIRYSDNEAMFLLGEHIGPEPLLAIEADLGLGLLVGKEGEQEIRLKDYAGVFRKLYNASYLGRQMSEYALELLSESTFQTGIVAGMPNDTVVAHKFGERTLNLFDGRELKQLHDCGIVYYPEKPYLLCIMTQGEDFQQQSKLIREISQVIYTSIEQR